MKKTMTLDEFSELVLKPAVDRLIDDVAADLEAARRFNSGLVRDDGASQQSIRVEFPR